VDVVDIMQQLQRTHCLYDEQSLHLVISPQLLRIPFGAARARFFCLINSTPSVWPLDGELRRGVTVMMQQACQHSLD